MSVNGAARALSRVPGAGITPLTKIRPARDRDYLDFIRAQPCAMCRAEGHTEPHHLFLPGDGGKARKPSDHQVVPLCGAGARDCHGYVQRYKYSPEQYTNLLEVGWRLLTWWLDAKAEGLV